MQTVKDMMMPVKSDPIWSKIAGLRQGPVFKPSCQQRIMLCGWPGSGKTTWVLSIPRCLVIDTEYGSDELMQVHKSSSRISVAKWEEVEEVLKALEADAETGKRRFDTVAIDTADGLGGNQHSLAGEFIVRDSNADVIGAFGSNGSGWARMSELYSRTFLRVQAAGYGYVATCHLTRKQVDDFGGGSRTMITRDLTRRCDAILRNRVGFIGVLQRKIEAVIEKGTTTVAGVKVSVVKGTRDVPQHSVVWRASSGDSATQEMVKSRVGIKDRMVFDETNGWSEWSKDYERAIAAAQSAAS